MALEKQLVPLPLTGGINVSQGNILRDPVALSRGDNIEQLKTGEYSKRKGFDLYDSGTYTATFPINNDVVCLGASSKIILSDGSTPATIPTTRNLKLNPGLWACEVKALVGLQQSIYSFDSAFVSGYLYVYVNLPSTLGGGPRLYRFDKNLNTLGYTRAGYSLEPFYQVETSAQNNARILKNGKLIYFLGSSIYTKALNNAVAGSMISSGTAANNQMDAVAFNDGTYVVAYDNTTNIVVERFNTSNVSVASATFSRTNVKTIHMWEGNDSSYFFLAVTRSSGNSNVYKINGTTLATLGTVNVTPPSSTVAINATGCTLTADADPSICMYFAFGVSDSDVNSQSVYYHVIANSAFTGTVTLSSWSSNVVVGQSHIASAPFLSGQNVQIMLGYQSIDAQNLQNSTYLMSKDKAQASLFNVVSKLASSTANNASSTFSGVSAGQYWIPRIAQFDTGEFCAPVFVRKGSNDGLSASQSVFGLNAAIISPVTRSITSKHVDIGSLSLIADGVVACTDGSVFTEYGFDIYPNPATIIAIGGGSITDNARYGIASVYEWYDAKGNLIESAPSFTFTDIPPGVGVQTLRYTVQTPPFSTKIAWRQSFYRTAPNGSIYYFAASISSSSLSSTVDESVAEATLITRKILYTTGGVVENINPNNVDFIGLSQNRLWTFERSSKTDLWHSKSIASGALPAFSDLLRVQVADSGGILIGVAQIEDKTLIFKRSAVYVTYGDGPTDTLVGQFSVPTLVADGIGCITDRSIVQTLDGVFFQSDEGIYMIDRSLTTQFIGRPIYGQAATVTSSIYIAADNKVIFATASDLYVYFLTTAAWYRWSLSGVQDIFISGGSLYAASSSIILKQGTGYQDNGSNYDQAVKLGQFQFAGIQGYQRIYRLLVTGAQTSNSSTLTVKNYFDGNSTATDTLTITAANSVSGNRMAFEIRPSRQKCETMEAEIIHSGNNEGIKISAVTAEVGAITGAGRRASTGRAV